MGELHDGGVVAGFRRHAAGGEARLQPQDGRDFHASTDDGTGGEPVEDLEELLQIGSPP